MEIKQEVGITNTDLTTEFKMSEQRQQHHWNKDEEQHSDAHPPQCFPLISSHTPSKARALINTVLCHYACSLSGHSAKVENVKWWGLPACWTVTSGLRGHSGKLRKNVRKKGGHCLLLSQHASIGIFSWTKDLRSKTFLGSSGLQT